MRARNFSDALNIVAISVMLCAVVRLAVADVGGGKGYPATPWRIEGPESVLDLEKAKALAATYQTLSVPAKLVDEEREGDLLELQRVGLVPTPFRESDIPIHELVGKSSSGETVALSFSQIESFTVISKNEKTITMSVTVWPEISPEELLQKQPTYKQLYADYRRNVVVDLSLESADGRPQVFAGKWGGTLPLNKLHVGAKGGFYEEHPHMVHPLRFWWAIPSVANDENYPFRLIPEM